jgi:hypothetical protein
MSQWKDVCESIVTYLNGESFSQAFAAGRLNRVVTESEASSAIRVYVFPVDRTRVQEERFEATRTFSLAIAVIKTLTATTPAAALLEEDDLLTLVDEIEDSIASQTSFGEYQVTKQFDSAGGARAPFSDEAMQKDIFVGGMTFTVVRIA